MKYCTINERIASQAKSMNSFRDYVEGSATAEYRNMVNKAAEIAERQKARVDPMYHERIDALLERYVRKLAANINEANAIDARVPSILISGAGNFPVHKKENQNASRNRNMGDYMEIEKLLDKIKSVGRGGISCHDPQAIDKLRSKLEVMEKDQEDMKSVNAYYRKHKTLEGCPGLSAEDISKLHSSMANDFRKDPVPYPSFLLSNNNANIHRVRERIGELEKRKNEPAPSGWTFDGGEVIMNQEDNRVQIMFDAKPDEDTRTALKSRGFRWAPSVGAWQRQLNANGIYAAKAVLKEIQ